MTNNKFYSILIVLTMATFLFSERGSFSVGNIKYDYNNVEFSFSERDVSMKFDIGKVQFSTANTGFEFIDDGPYESVSMKIGPSKVLLQNIDYEVTYRDYYNDYSTNHAKFNLGTFRFDLNEFEVDFAEKPGPDIPEIHSLNTKLTANNIVLDLSGVIFDRYTEERLRQLGNVDRELKLNRATISANYSSNQFKFSVDGMTSLGNIKINFMASINEYNPELSVCQSAMVTISNLSSEAQSLINLVQAENPSMIIPMVNGSITFDLKDIINAQIQRGEFDF